MIDVSLRPDHALNALPHANTFQYRLPDSVKGLHGFMLCVETPRQMLSLGRNMAYAKKQLQSATALTPPSTIPAPALNVNYLTLARGITIQPMTFSGNTLFELHENELSKRTRSNSPNAALYAADKLFQMMDWNNVERNTDRFTRLFTDLQSRAAVGYTDTLSLDNIRLYYSGLVLAHHPSTPPLATFDAHNNALGLHYMHQQVQQLRKEFIHIAEGDTLGLGQDNEKQARTRRCCDHILKAIDAAERNVTAAYDTHHTKPPVFVDVSDVKAISLTEPPQELVKQLFALRDRTDISR